MTLMLFDFSQKADLKPLALVVSALQAVARPAGMDFFLIGAAARDLLLRYAYGMAAQRQTEDVDCAVALENWAAFDQLRAALLANGEFVERPGSVLHRLRHKSGLPLDIVPFGGIERADRTIAWPPDQSTVLDCFGAREAFSQSVNVRLPENVDLRVASIPAQAVLKIMAWQDRKHTHPGRDAPDMLLFMRCYMDCDNLDRAVSEHADLFSAGDYDHETAGACLLGRDIAAFLDLPARQRLAAVLMPESRADQPLLLARQSGLELERARRLIETLCGELINATDRPTK
jgi:predicted nucleotidyltransferase